MALCAFFLFCAGNAAAQTIPHVTGTFKTPEGKTPAQAGLKQIATIGSAPGVAVYGTVDFQPYDSQGNRPARILCGGITYLPQRVRGWIQGDGTLVDNYTGAAGVDLVPEIGCTPAGLVMRSFVTLAPSADGRIPSVSWSEDKQIPQQASADWGALAAAGITAPVYSGYSTVQSAGASLQVRNILNFTAGGCADNPLTLATDCTATGGGATHQLNGVSLTAQSPVNFQDQGPITWSNPSLGNVKATLGIVGIANGGLNNSAAPSSDGQVPIWNAAQSQYVPGDPIVSGPAAEGAAPANNPVWVSGKGADGFIHAVRMANDGTVRVDPTGTTTQPVSGSVTANVGTTNGLALDATLTGGTQKTKLVDTGGVNVASISAAGAVKVDNSAVTQPVSAASLPLPTGAATEATLAALNTKIPASPATDRATAAAPGAVRLSDGTSFYKSTTPADTQPVSAASLPLPAGAATEATLSALNGKIAKSNNGAAPGANNIGTLPAVANAAAPTLTEGNQAALSTDLGGNLRVSNAAADTTGTLTALGALNAAASVSLTGQQSASVFLASGTLTGTLVPEFSMDGGTTWTAGFFYNPATNAIISSTSVTNPNAAAQLTILAPGGASGARARVSAYTSGTANATARAAMTAGARVLSTLYDSGGQERGIQAFPLFARITDGTNNMPTGDASARSIHTTCDSGCGGAGGTAAADNSVFTGGTTNVTPMGALYDTTPPAVTDGNVGAPRMDVNRQLMVNCTTGCTPGGSFADSTAFTFGTTAIGNMGAVVDDVATNTVAENSAGAPRMNTNRILYFNPRNNAGTEIATAANPYRVDPTGTTTQPVSGTFWQTTQPVSAASLPLPTGASTEATLSALNTKLNTEITADYDTGAGTQTMKFVGLALPASGGAVAGGTSANPINVVFPSAQAVTLSSTSANQGTAAALSGAWPVKITDGTNSMPTGDASARSIHVTADVLPALPTGANTIGAVNLAQYTPATGRLPVDGSGVTQPVSGTVTANAGTGNFNDASVGATGSAVPSSAKYFGGNGSGNLKGITSCDNWTPISLTANTQIITGAASKQTYICSINLVAGAATNVAVVEGTGTTCATGTAGVFGGATAATGWNFAANGGIAQGTGLGAIGRTATAADNVCILVSAANQVSGGISWTQF